MDDRERWIRGKRLQGFRRYKVAEVCRSSHFAVEWSKFIVCSMMTLTLSRVGRDKLIRILAPPRPESGSPSFCVGKRIGQGEKS